MAERERERDRNRWRHRREKKECTNLTGILGETVKNLDVVMSPSQEINTNWENVIKFPQVGTALKKKNHHPDNYMSCIKEIQFDFSLPFNLILNLMLNAAFY